MTFTIPEKALDFASGLDTQCVRIGDIQDRSVIGMPVEKQHGLILSCKQWRDIQLSVARDLSSVCSS